MQYMSIIRGPENQGVPPQALQDAIEAHVTQSLQNGTLVQAGGLAPSTSGARIRIQGGKLSVTDGPFTESKEIIGGWGIIADSPRETVIEDAIALMRLHLELWPEWQGECEIREVVFLGP